jgi:hypothetical protein
MAISVNVFDFVREYERVMFESAFNAISQLELWPYMRNFTGESFMFSQEKNVSMIYNKIEELGYHGHSGASFGCIMRAMQYIAINGLDSFREAYVQNKKIDSLRESLREAYLQNNNT